MADESEEIKKKINLEKDPKNLDFLQKIGFIPKTSLEDYNVEYELYDFCEQNLIYHIFLLKHQKIEITQSILFLKFEKLVTNFAIYSEGKMSTKLKEKIENCDDLNNKENLINFIKKVNDMYKGINVAFSYFDYDEEKKKKLMEMIEQIKKYCKEECNPPIPIVIYDKNDMNINIFKYMNLFYHKSI